MEFFKKMGVHKKVPSRRCQEDGLQGHHHRIVWTRTRVIHPGQTIEAGSLVARLSMIKRLDLFSAAPPLETLKFLCSMYARGQTCPEPCRLAVIDIKRAYFNALARRPIFIEIPQNGLEPGTTVVSSCAKCNDGIFFFGAVQES